MFCCLLCLTVCAGPVFAEGDDVYIEDYVYNKRVWGFSETNTGTTMHYPFSDVGSVAGFGTMNGIRSVKNLVSTSYTAAREWWNRNNADSGSDVYFLFRFAYTDVTINYLDFYVGYYKTSTRYTSDPALDGHTITRSQLGLSTYGSVYDGADENGKQTNSDKKPTRNKFAEAAEMDDDVVDA